MRVGPVAWLAVLAAIVAGGCQVGDDDARETRIVDTYEAAVRSALGSGNGSRVPDDDRPVVYVVGLDGESIAPGVQARVVKRLVDDIDVRFADERDEAFDGGEPGGPVHDDGMLLELGEVPEGGGPFDLTTVRHRSEEDRHEVVVAFRADGDGVSVSSTTLVS